MWEWLKKQLGVAPETTQIPYTPRAAATIKIAVDASQKEERSVTTVSDVASALVDFNKGCAIEVLKRFGFDGDKLRKVVRTPTPDQTFEDLLPVAQEEMRAMYHRWLGTEHLLLALVRVGNNWLGDALAKEGVTIELAREEVMRELDPNSRVRTVEEIQSDLHQLSAEEMRKIRNFLDDRR